MDKELEQEALLTEGEIKCIVERYTISQRSRIITQAQLRKAEPIIRADERKRIGKWLEERNHITPIDIRVLKRGEMPE